MRDFTIEYRELCQALRDADYALVNVYQYLTNHSDRKVAVLRHDVDRKPENARAVPDSSTVLTPVCFKKNLGKKQLRFDGCLSTKNRGKRSEPQKLVSK